MQQLLLMSFSLVLEGPVSAEKDYRYAEEKIRQCQGIKSIKLY